MNVKQLIEMLEGYPEDLIVIVKGDDEAGAWADEIHLAIVEGVPRHGYVGDPFPDMSDEDRHAQKEFLAIYY